MLAVLGFWLVPTVVAPLLIAVAAGFVRSLR